MRHRFLVTPVLSNAWLVTGAFLPCYAQNTDITKLFLVQKQGHSTKRFTAVFKGDILLRADELMSNKTTIDGMNGVVQTVQIEGGKPMITIKTVVDWNLKTQRLVVTTEKGQTYVIYDIKKNPKADMNNITLVGKIRLAPTHGTRKKRK